MIIQIAEQTIVNTDKGQEMGINVDGILSEIRESYADYNAPTEHYKYLAVKQLIDETEYDFEGVSINYAFNGVIEMVKEACHECFAIAEPKSINSVATYVDAFDNECENISASIASLGWD